LAVAYWALSRHLPMPSITHRIAWVVALAGSLTAGATSAWAQSRTVQGDGPTVPPAPPAGRSLVAVRATVGGDEVVRTARRFIGVPYRLGGTTPRAFDCSGFVRYVFALHGIAMPRTAHEQAALGEAPAPGDSLAPGDLLFFWGGHGVQHIAIYIGGDSIIHASSSAHVVRLDRLTGARVRRTWFNQRLIAVRRMLPQEGVWYVPAESPEYSFITRVHPGW
jgi:cell wall-associated NlpC family hydrolase